MAHILVVDDEAGFRALLRDILEEAGHAVTEARDGAEALAFLERGAFDLVLTDRQMPKVDGLELVRRIRARPSPPPVVVLTAHGSIPEAVDAVRLGAADYITKPLPSPGALVDLVASLLPREEEGDDFVTQDPSTKELLALVDRVAARDIAVLVTGESGTGKELIARRLHARSPRAKGPFVAVNAAALPETLAESELFGAEKGAFTGADQARAGRFEEANGGTIFLDEVGELPAPLQAKLLRVLEERVVRRLGGLARPPGRRPARCRDEPRPHAGIRVREVPAGPLLPPRRRRREPVPAPGAARDIPLLARHFAVAPRGPAPGPGSRADRRGARGARGPPVARERPRAEERPRAGRRRPGGRAHSGGGPRPGRKPAGQHLPGPGAPRTRGAPGGPSPDRRAEGRGGAALLGISVRTLYYRLKQWGIG